MVVASHYKSLFFVNKRSHIWLISWYFWEMFLGRINIDIFYRYDIILVRLSIAFMKQKTWRISKRHPTFTKSVDFSKKNFTRKKYWPTMMAYLFCNLKTRKTYRQDLEKRQDFLVSLLLSCLSRATKLHRSRFSKSIWYRVKFLKVMDQSQNRMKLKLDFFCSVF